LVLNAASPAAVDRELYVRAEKYLYRIEKPTR
jgi:hypothetical protein